MGNIGDKIAANIFKTVERLKTLVELGFHVVHGVGQRTGNAAGNHQAEERGQQKDDEPAKKNAVLAGFKVGGRQNEHRG